MSYIEDLIQRCHIQKLTIHSLNSTHISHGVRHVSKGWGVGVGVRVGGCGTHTCMHVLNQPFRHTGHHKMYNCFFQHFFTIFYYFLDFPSPPNSRAITGNLTFCEAPAILSGGGGHTYYKVSTSATELLFTIQL